MSRAFCEVRGGGSSDLKFRELPRAAEGGGVSFTDLPGCEFGQEEVEREGPDDGREDDEEQRDRQNALLAPQLQNKKQCEGHSV